MSLKSPNTPSTAACRGTRYKDSVTSQITPIRKAKSFWQSMICCCDNDQQTLPCTPKNKSFAKKQLGQSYLSQSIMSFIQNQCENTLANEETYSKMSQFKLYPPVQRKGQSSSILCQLSSNIRRPSTLYNYPQLVKFSKRSVVINVLKEIIREYHDSTILIDTCSEYGRASLEQVLDTLPQNKYIINIHSINQRRSSSLFRNRQIQVVQEGGKNKFEFDFFFSEYFSKTHLADQIILIPFPKQTSDLMFELLSNQLIEHLKVYLVETISYYIKDLHKVTVFLPSRILFEDIQQVLSIVQEIKFHQERIHLKKMTFHLTAITDSHGSLQGNMVQFGVSDDYVRECMMDSLFYNHMNASKEQMGINDQYFLQQFIDVLDCETIFKLQQSTQDHGLLKKNNIYSYLQRFDYILDYSFYVKQQFYSIFKRDIDDSQIVDSYKGSKQQEFGNISSQLFLSNQEQSAKYQFLEDKQSTPRMQSLKSSYTYSSLDERQSSQPFVQLLMNQEQELSEESFKMVHLIDNYEPTEVNTNEEYQDDSRAKLLKKQMKTLINNLTTQNKSHGIRKYSD